MTSTHTDQTRTVVVKVPAKTERQNRELGFNGGGPWPAGLVGLLIEMVVLDPPLAMPPVIEACTDAELVDLVDMTLELDDEFVGVLELLAGERTQAHVVVDLLEAHFVTCVFFDPAVINIDRDHQHAGEIKAAAVDVQEQLPERCDNIDGEAHRWWEAHAAARRWLRERSEPGAGRG